MSVLIIGRLLPDPFPAFLYLVCGTENYTSQTPSPIVFWIGPANQGQWKEMEDKPEYFFPLCVQPGLCSISISSFAAAEQPRVGPAPSGRPVAVPASVWWPQLPDSWDTAFPFQQKVVGGGGFPLLLISGVSCLFCYFTAKSLI